ncbi:MAG: hypothetical protein ABWX92_04205 [Mycetocola sp.]
MGSPLFLGAVVDDVVPPFHPVASFERPNSIDGLTRPAAPLSAAPAKLGA